MPQVLCPKWICTGSLEDCLINLTSWEKCSEPCTIQQTQIEQTETNKTYIGTNLYLLDYTEKQFRSGYKGTAQYVANHGMKASNY